MPTNRQASILADTRPRKAINSIFPTAWKVVDKLWIPLITLFITEIDEIAAKAKRGIYALTAF